MEFVAAAKAYLSWADSAPADGSADVRTAHRLLARLYLAALNLPTDSGLPEVEIEERSVQDGEREAMLPRFASLPFDYYSVQLKPHELGADAEECQGAGQLTDDLASVWRDVREAMLDWDAGDVLDAVWDWRESFQTHWGEHCVEALWAIHAWFLENFDQWNEPSGGCDSG
jgi:hypothetical protein